MMILCWSTTNTLKYKSSVYEIHDLKKLTKINDPDITDIKNPAISYLNYKIIYYICLLIILILEIYSKNFYTHINSFLLILLSVFFVHIGLFSISEVFFLLLILNLLLLLICIKKNQKISDGILLYVRKFSSYLFLTIGVLNFYQLLFPLLSIVFLWNFVNHLQQISKKNTNCYDFNPKTDTLNHSIKYQVRLLVVCCLYFLFFNYVTSIISLSIIIVLLIIKNTKPQLNLLL